MFNNNLRNEIIMILENYDTEICPDCQIKILAICAKFVNSTEYMDKVKQLFDVFFINRENVNFWIELPKMISVLIDFNNTIQANKEIPIDHVKFAIYAIIYAYLDNYQSILLNSLDQGGLRISFFNILAILLTKPKKIAVKKQSIINALLNCMCGDDGIIKI